MYSNNIVNFQESTTILNVCRKMSGNLLKAPRIYCHVIHATYAACERNLPMDIQKISPKSFKNKITKQQSPRKGHMYNHLTVRKQMTKFKLNCLH